MTQIAPNINKYLISFLNKNISSNLGILNHKKYIIMIGIKISILMIVVLNPSSNNPFDSLVLYKYNVCQFIYKYKIIKN